MQGIISQYPKYPYRILEKIAAAIILHGNQKAQTVFGSCPLIAVYPPIGDRRTLISQPCDGVTLYHVLFLSSVISVITELPRTYSEKLFNIETFWNKPPYISIMS